jgi:hypothetical protein
MNLPKQMSDIKTIRSGTTETIMMPGMDQNHVG